MTALDLKAIQANTQTIARDASEILMQHFGSSFIQDLKGTFDVVTQADRESEALVVEAIQSQYPDHHIVGEEGGGYGAPIEEAAYRWYVDPLDGTTNFANGIPVFSVSLALTTADLEPLVGVVYAPVADEMFTAIAGGGAMLNDKPIRVSDENALENGVFASGFPYDKYTAPDNNLAQWGAFLTRTRGLRRMGSAAIDLAYVAAGRFDGYWESKLNPWDCLAGGLCVREAGGIVTDYDGNAGGEIFTRGYLVAANPTLHAQMLDVLANVPGTAPSSPQT